MFRKLSVLPWDSSRRETRILLYMYTIGNFFNWGKENKSRYRNFNGHIRHYILYELDWDVNSLLHPLQTNVDKLHMSLNQEIWWDFSSCSCLLHLTMICKRCISYMQLRGVCLRVMSDCWINFSTIADEE